MRLEQLPENFTVEDWTDFLLNLFQSRVHTGGASRASFARGLWALDKEYEDKYLIAEVLAHLVDSDYPSVVGYSSQLITPRVFEIELHEFLPGYPFKYAFFEKCCLEEHQHRYMRHWLAVYTDTLTASGQYVPKIGFEEYSSWDEVKQIATTQLEEAVDTLVEDYLERGFIEYGDESRDGGG